MKAVTNRKLFSAITEMESFIQTLTKIEDLDGGWSTKYRDDETGLYWLKYVVEDKACLEDLMLISPPPTTDDLIEIAFTSNYPDEVLAAARRLSIEEQVDKKEYRQKLNNRLDQIKIALLDKSERERLRTIAQSAQLTDRVNKREVLGKQLLEIQKDAQFFEVIADRAQEIINRL